jgi:hypothetical protein
MTMFNGYGLPGVRTERTALPRKVFWHDAERVILPAGVIIDGSKSRDPLNSPDVDVLRAGLVLGKISASGKYAPSILGVTTAAYASGGTSLTVSVATATELVRRIGTSGTFKTVGPPTAGGTVAVTTTTFSAVNLATGVITVTSLGVDKVTNVFVMPTDGSETILGIIEDGEGIKVTDIDGTSLDTPCSKLAIGGILVASQILNYPADAALKVWLKAQLRAVTIGFAFDDDFR